MQLTLKQVNFYIQLCILVTNLYILILGGTSNHDVLRDLIQKHHAPSRGNTVMCQSQLSRRNDSNSPTDQKKAGHLTVSYDIPGASVHRINRGSKYRQAVRDLEIKQKLQNQPRQYNRSGHNSALASYRPSTQLQAYSKTSQLEKKSGNPVVHIADGRDEKQPTQVEAFKTGSSTSELKTSKQSCSDYSDKSD